MCDQDATTVTTSGSLLLDAKRASEQAHRRLLVLRAKARHCRLSRAALQEISDGLRARARGGPADA